MNPTNPDQGDWGTHVRDERMRVGDRLTLPRASVEWEVVRIELVGDEGQPAAVRWLGRPNVIWDGTLVLRPVE